jgi:sec-independent protein translocase protein TatB
MFDVAPTELLLVAVVALVVIGPKDLPRAMRVVGQWVGRARGMARHFRSGIDEMIRQSELEEMEKKWREENERIMREFPTLSDPVALPDHSAATSEPAALPPDAASAAAPALTPPVDEVGSEADLANWHAAATPPEPSAEAAPETAPHMPPVAPPAEEQLSLLPPDPDGSRPADDAKKSS